MRYFATTIICCSLAVHTIHVLGESAAEKTLKEMWEIPPRNPLLPNRCPSAYRKLVAELFQDLRNTFELLELAKVNDNEQFWLQPPDWFDQLQQSWFGVSSEPAREHMASWFNGLARRLAGKEPIRSDYVQKPLLFCDSTVMKLYSWKDHVPVRFRTLKKPLMTMQDYLNDNEAEFNKYWWFYLAAKEAWVLLDRNTYGAMSDMGTPFLRSAGSKGGSTFCAGSVVQKQSHALTITPVAVDSFLQHYPIVTQPVLILCPSLYDYHDQDRSKEKLDLENQPPQKTLAKMTPSK